MGLNRSFIVIFTTNSDAQLNCVPKDGLRCWINGRIQWIWKPEGWFDKIDSFNSFSVLFWFVLFGLKKIHGKAVLKMSENWLKVECKKIDNKKCLKV